jgi:hypothetical protein
MVGDDGTNQMAGFEGNDNLSGKEVETSPEDLKVMILYLVEKEMMYSPETRVLTNWWEEMAMIKYTMMTPTLLIPTAVKT